MIHLAKKEVVFVVSLIFAISCQNQNEHMTKAVAPVAKKLPKELKIHNDIRIDDYYWLNERENPEVIAYLNKEREYYKDQTAHTEHFQNSLFEEMKARIKEDDTSVPYKQNGYWYLTRFETGKEYPIYCRHKGSLEAPEEIMFDGNEMAKGHEFFKLGGIAVSPDNTLAAFGIDTVSRRQFTIQIKNLETGQIYDEKIENTTAGAVWAKDNKTLFYTKKDPVTLRPNKIFKHALNSPAKDDQLVFHEDDETFETYVYKSKSKKYIIIGCYSTLTSEFHTLNAETPELDFKVFSKRKRGLEYAIAHYNDSFYILTNKDKAKNFKLMKVGEEHTASEHWQEFIPHREEVLLEEIEIFKEYYVLSERENGLNKLKVCRWDNADTFFVPFESETYTAFVGRNPEYDTDALRYTYNSLTTPTSVIDFKMSTGEKVVKKEQDVLGGTV